MKNGKLLFLTLVASLLLVGCQKGGGNQSISSDEEQDDSSSSSTYHGPTDLFVAFFLDYNVADFDQPYYSYKTKQGELLTPPEKTPTSEDAIDPAYPVFKGWSSHTVIDSDDDLWDFAHDVVGLGERTYLYLYGIWEAGEEPEPEEYINYAMYRTTGEWTKKEMSINPENDKEYMLKDLPLEANSEIVFCIDGDGDGIWYHYSDLKDASVGTYEKSPAYQHDDGNTYSDDNIIVKQAGKYDIYLDTSADKDDNAAIYMARDTSEDPVVEKVFYLSPGVWDTANAWFAIYAFGNGDEWYQMTKVGDYYQVPVNVTKYTKIIFTRMDPSKTLADGWDAKWNQTNDLTVNDGNLYTITGWGDGKSPGSWSNI